MLLENPLQEYVNGVHTDAQSTHSDCIQLYLQTKWCHELPDIAEVAFTERALQSNVVNIGLLSVAVSSVKFLSSEPLLRINRITLFNALSVVIFTQQEKVKAVPTSAYDKKLGVLFKAFVVLLAQKSAAFPISQLLNGVAPVFVREVPHKTSVTSDNLYQATRLVVSAIIQ